MPARVRYVGRVAPDDFEARYRTLAVTTCEWRAYGVADPEAMADRVFAALRSSRRPTTLRALYRTVEAVVSQAYQDQASGRPLVEGILAGQLAGLRRTPAEANDGARLALSRLPDRDVTVLRQRFWDELSDDEMAQINGRTPAAEAALVATALAHFAARLPPDVSSDPAAAMRALHPGTHRRFQDIPAATA